MQRDLYRYTLALFSGLALVACMSLRAEQMTAKEKEALRIGEKYISVHYTDFDQRNKDIVIKDAGDRWEVTYELPEDMIGGAPVVIIDKRTMEVVNSFRTQ